ncbi:MAG: hypothetical protein KBF74_10180 [Ferruginibacter sp.]|nr:hypothetical protein [Ferruginibacter sp.]
MKKIILIVAILSSLQARAQESTNIARKEYLAVLTLTERYKDDKNWGKPEKDIIGEHFQRLGYMKQEGIVVMAGRTQLESNDPYMMGLVIFYAKDDKEALQFIMDDPAVKGNIMLAKVHPYGIAVGKCD